MSLTMIVSNAGRAALVNAANTGTAPVTIATCGISASAVVPAVGATTLPGEIKRIATLSGDVVADDTIHLVVRDEGSSVFTLRSFALYLADGTLFAIYGQASPILEKSAQSIMLLALDVRFADVAATSLTFGDANFLNPPATTDQIGVVELATLAEQMAGTDDRRVAAVKTIKDAVFSWLDARFGANNAGIWHPGNDGAGSGLDADLLDGQQGSYYTAIAARLGYTPANKAGDTFSGGINATAFNLTTSTNSGFYASGGNPIIGMDLGDYQYYDKAANTFGFVISDSLKAYVGADGYVNAVVGFKAAGNIVWHAGNDGSGSGLDADLLDGLHASSFATANNAQTITGRKDFAAGVTGNSGMATATQNLGEIEVRGNGVGAAMMSFHRPGSFAAYFGVDVDSSWRVGGWSMGAASHILWHSGNDGAGSALDADLLDGVQGGGYLRREADIWQTSQEGQRRYLYAGNSNTFFGTGAGFLFQRNDNVNVTTIDSSGNLSTLGVVYSPGAMFSGDVTINRAAAPGTGALFFGSGAGRYLYYDGTSFHLQGAELYGNGGNRVWHAGNDGSGSGLDADLLDGHHASDFALNGGFTYGSNANGYWCRRPDGVIEQWGRFATSGLENFYTVTFPIAFTNAASISISATAVLRNSNDDVFPAISGSPTTDSFTVLQNAIGDQELTNGFHWRAIGV